MSSGAYSSEDLTPYMGFYRSAHANNYGLSTFVDPFTTPNPVQSMAMPQGSCNFMLNTFWRGSTNITRPSVRTCVTSNINSTQCGLLASFLIPTGEPIVFYTDLTGVIRYIANGVITTPYEPHGKTSIGLAADKVSYNFGSQAMGDTVVYSDSRSSNVYGYVYAAVIQGTDVTGTYNIGAGNDVIYLTVDGVAMAPFNLTNGAAQTLDDVINDINNAAVGVTAMKLYYNLGFFIKGWSLGIVSNNFTSGGSVEVMAIANSANATLGLTAYSQVTGIAQFHVPPQAAIATDDLSQGIPYLYKTGIKRTCFAQGRLFVSNRNVLTWSDTINNPAISFFQPSDFPAQNYLIIGETQLGGDDRTTEQIGTENIVDLYVYDKYIYVFTDRNIYRVYAAAPDSYELVIPDMGASSLVKGSGSLVFFTWKDSCFRWQLNTEYPKNIRYDKKGFDRIGNQLTYNLWETYQTTTRVIGINTDLQHVYFEVPAAPAGGKATGYILNSTVLGYDYAKDYFFYMTYRGEGSTNRVLTDMIYWYRPNTNSIYSQSVTYDKVYIMAFANTTLTTSNGDICSADYTSTSQDLINKAGVATLVTIQKRLQSRFVTSQNAMIMAKNTVVTGDFTPTGTLDVNVLAPTASSPDTVTSIQSRSYDLTAAPTGNLNRLIGLNYPKRRFLGLDFDMSKLETDGFSRVTMAVQLENVGDDTRMPW